MAVPQTKVYQRKHKYCQWKTWFDGTIKNEEALKHQDEKFVFEMIKNIKLVFGKPVKGKIEILTLLKRVQDSSCH
jgi:hypothetical protein